MSTTIVLIGLSGTGKSTVGAVLARALGRRCIDTDQEVEARAGRSIAEIFTKDGEAAFRRLEAEALARAVDAGNAVVATGGGIVELPANLALLSRATVVWLTAKPHILASRLAAHRDRPLLAGDPLAALEDQAARRAHRYAAAADWVVATDHLAPSAVADEVQRLVTTRTAADAGHLAVTTPGGNYEVVIAAGALGQLAERLRPLAPRGRVWIVSNDRVWPLHGAPLLATLEAAGIAAQAFQIPDGEAFKNLATVATVYDWLLAHKVERGDLLIAFGGGVVGDLAGYVASTVLRGISFVQIPTTVLAIVDSSIGGKTGVDHAAGKNLIGTFYQPRLVLADPALLTTLPEPERRAGWAEAIKHGVIADAELFDDLVAHEPRLRLGAEPQTSELLRRAAAVKVRVVSGDEREQGARILLNYGHTIGHALEHWSDYTIRHGEGVAIGMCVAAAISRRLNLCDVTLEARLHAALNAFGLPRHLPATVEPAALIEATRSDKKVRGKRVNWVLPTSIGAATVRNDVPDTVVVEALDELREPAT